MILKKIKESVKITSNSIFYKNNWIIFLIVSLLSFFILYKFTLATVANQDLSIFIMMSGVNSTFFNLMTLGIISILFGIYFTLFYHKIRLMRKASKTGFLGFIGMIIGAFAAGCPTCGAFLFSLIGMPLALIYLPFRGLELKILSMMVLLISIYFISKSMIKCEKNKCVNLIKKRNI